jgi:uncharacterized membrane protein
LFGDQLVYDRAEFEQASGINTADFSGLLKSRDFQGNEQMGYKVALCERDVAIYFAMAIGGMAYALARRRVRKIPWMWLVLIGVIPIGLDGFSQLLSQPPFNLIPFRESNWLLRLATGALFGFSIAWIVFPLIENAMGPGPLSGKTSQIKA